MLRPRTLGLLLPLLVACGAESGPNETADAPTRDGETSAQPTTPVPPVPSTPSDPATPAEPMPVTVSVVTWAGAPAADIEVVFHDANGAVTKTAKTDANGNAASTGPTTPAMVTAMLAGAKSKHLVTWTSVAAGDVLKVKNVKWGHDDVGTYDVKFGAVQNANLYLGNVGQCVGSQNNANVSLALGVSPYCVSGQPNAALVRTTVNGVMRTAWAKNLAPALGPAPVAVNVGPWQLASTVTVTPTNLPALELPPDLAFDEVAGTTRFENPAHVTLEAPVALKVAPGLADAYQMSSTIVPTGGGIFTVAKRVAPGPAQTIDYASLLPRIVDRSADHSRPARPSVTWSPASSLAATDGGIVTLRWFTADAAPRGWTFFVSPTATKVDAPVMPASAETWLPKPGDGGQAGPKISFVKSDAFEGARGLRANGAWMVPLGEAYDWGYGMAVRHMTLPAGTTLRATHSN